MLTAFIVNTAADENNGIAGGTSLREAIGLANANADADTISFDTAGAFATPQTITLTLGESAITKALTITGPGAASLTINANGASRIFNVDDGDAAAIDVEIAGLTLTGGLVSEFGGAIRNAENWTSPTARSLETRLTAKAAAFSIPAR